jgi:hypothetical protein
MIPSQILAAAIRQVMSMSSQDARQPKLAVMYQARQGAGLSDQPVRPVRGSRMVSAPSTMAAMLGGPEGKASAVILSRTAI